MTEPHPIFFFDRCTGKKFPDGVRSLLPPGAVIAHWEVYGEAPVPDDEWLTRCGAGSWLAITADSSLRKSQLTIAVVLQFGIGLFEFHGNRNADQKIDTMRLALPRMLRIAKAESGPFLYRVHRGGAVTRKVLPCNI